MWSCQQKNTNFFTFSADKISSLEVNGEKKEPVQFFTEKLQETATYKAEKIYEERKDEVDALLYIARIDNRFMPREREIISSFFGMEPQAVPGEIPNSGKFKAAIKRLKKDLPAEKYEALKKAAIELGGKNPDPLKKAAIDMI